MTAASYQMEQALMAKFHLLPEALLKVLETLSKIVKNILSDPYELKFRTLKKSNSTIQRMVLDNAPVVAFLKKIGFEESEESLCLDKWETHELYFIEDALEQMVIHHSAYQQFAHEHNTNNNKNNKNHKNSNNHNNHNNNHNNNDKKGRNKEENMFIPAERR